jgi:hypothetical protein
LRGLFIASSGWRQFSGTWHDPAGPRPGLGIVVPVTSDVDRFRYPDIHILDLRVAKDFSFSDLGLTLSADLFNALGPGSLSETPSLWLSN